MSETRERRDAKVKSDVDPLDALAESLRELRRDYQVQNITISRRLDEIDQHLEIIKREGSV